MPERRKSPIIKNLMPGLSERGKIKIGKKGAERNGSNGVYQLPQKLDHFLITTLERGKDNNFVINKEIHEELGEAPKVIPITLLYDDISLNFQCRYTCYFGKTLYCSGDGECADRLKAKDSPERHEVPCPCHRNDPTFTGDDGKGKGKCKINGTLSVMIACKASTVGGVWKFRTTGYNSTVGILSSLSLIKTITGGALAGIPLNLTIVPKVATNPVDNSAVTVYVVGVEFAGNVQQLRDAGMKISLGDATYRQRLAHIEEEAKLLLSVDSAYIDEAADIVDEYYPEEHGQPEVLPPEGAKEIVLEAEVVPVDPVPEPKPEPTKKPTKKPEPVAVEVTAEVSAPVPVTKPEPASEPIAAKEPVQTTVFGDIPEDLF